MKSPKSIKVRAEKKGTDKHSVKPSKRSANKTPLVIKKSDQETAPIVSSTYSVKDAII